MPVLDTGRKQLSSVIATGSGCQDKGIQKSYATIGLLSASSATIEPMGIPVIYRDLVAEIVDPPTPAVPAQWVIYTNQSLGSSDSTLPNGAKVGVVIGKNWAGDNNEDVTLDDEAVTNLVVVYRDATVKMAGITFTGNSAAQTAFRLALEKQDVVVIDSEANAQPSYEA